MSEVYATGSEEGGLEWVGLQCADRRPTEDRNEGNGIDTEKLKMLPRVGED